jgi:predicted PurR-regulated permease PerM
MKQRKDDDSKITRVQFPQGPEQRGQRGPTAAQGLLTLGIAAVLYLGRLAFIPVALALLLSLILSGPVEALHARRLPRSVGAVLIMLILASGIAATFHFVSEPARDWLANAPHTLNVFKHKLRPLAQSVARVEDFANRATTMSTRAPRSDAAAPPAPVGAPVIWEVTRTAVVSTVTVIILTIFLLAAGPPILARMTAALAGNVHASRAMEIIEHTRRDVGKFYLTTALINVGLGTATTLAMLACGMPNPLLWGTMAAVLNFLPYLGPATTLVVLISVAIVSFDGLGNVLAVGGSFLALTTLEGQVVQPLLVGKRLALNPLVLFLSLWFGGFFWGVAGVALAVPTLVTLKVVAENSRNGQRMLAFLS